VTTADPRAAAEAARAALRRQLEACPKASLIRLLTAGVRRPDGEFSYSLTPPAELARWRKDEVVAAILDIAAPRHPEVTE
jgi:hypothetical protein